MSIKTTLDAVKAQIAAVEGKAVAEIGTVRAFFTAYWKILLIGFVLGVILGTLVGCSASPIPPAQGASDTVSWTNPSTRTDGSALTNLDHVTIQWGAKGGPYSAGSLVVSEIGKEGQPGSATVPSLASGTRCYVLSATDATGLTSAQSNEACKTITAAPNPPAGVTVQ